MTQPKGVSHRKDPRKARPGNTNKAKGPRVGRRERSVTKNVAAPALPQPRAGATLLHPPTGRPKAGGKDFAPGTNGHDGTVFRRTEDMLPRGNALLLGKIMYHDYRKKIYDQVGKGIEESPAFAFAFWKDITDRIHGTATKKTETTTRPPATFVLTSADGSERPAFPERVAGAATPGEVSAEDAMILGLQPIR